ncbi:MAG: hypothetical protein DMF75_16740 [Acidobacteria bacterium]|nr:MAG: hypothetical protein DMF75_16740 [Acidobacteriota bacterium]
MVNEVESILNEIRERVRADENQREAASALTIRNGHGLDSSPSPSTIATGPESLARLEAHLTTTSRAWDRLPPVFSNRSGMAARLELWLKARLKSLSRWFTWEQINFNSAVHHGLSDALEGLRAHEQQLIRMQTELNQTKEALRVELNQTTEILRSESRQTTEILRSESRQNTEALRSESRQTTEALQADLAHTAEALRGESSQTNEALASELRQTAASLRADFGQTAENLLATIDARGTEMNARVAELGDDLHEEQRVCFKQLSLEASEAAVLEDRGRRALEARLEKLERLRSEKKS